MQGITVFFLLLGFLLGYFHLSFPPVAPDGRILVALAPLADLRFLPIIFYDFLTIPFPRLLDRGLLFALLQTRCGVAPFNRISFFPLGATRFGPFFSVLSYDLFSALNSRLYFYSSPFCARARICFFSICFRLTELPKSSTFFLRPERVSLVPKG